LPTPTPLASTLIDVGRAGRRLAELGAAEGAAGNLSVYVGPDAAAPPEFSRTEQLELPAEVPDLAGGWLVVTGSGRRLRDLADDPGADLGCIRVDAGGRTARLFTAPQRRSRGSPASSAPTSWCTRTRSAPRGRLTRPWSTRSRGT
jgi:rhamnulose-1-phosphate aldolase